MANDDGQIDGRNILNLSLKPPPSKESPKAASEGTCRGCTKNELDIDNDAEDETNSIYIEVPLRNCYVAVTEVAEFQCRVSNVPKNTDGEQPSTWYWYKNGMLIRETKRISFTVRHQWHRLRIKGVTSSDHGVYTFIYENNTKRVVSQAILFVLDKSPARSLYTSFPRSGLRVVKHLSNFNSKIGQRIRLFAKFEADKRFDIQYTWLKNNQPLARTKEAFFSDSSSRFSEFSLDAADSSDSGIYTVIAKTNDSYVSSMCEVFVKDEQLSNLTIECYEGFIESLPEEVETYNSEEVRLICQISDLDNTQICWFKDNILLNENENRKFEQYGGKAIGLTLSAPQVEDMGEYTVVIKNKITGRLWKSTCFLYVTQSSKVQKLPEVLVESHLTRTYASIGSSLFLYCKFKIPNCKYLYAVWYLGLYKIERSNQQFKVISHDGFNLLFINEVEPDMIGEIRCQLRYVPPNQRSVPVASTRGSLHHLHPSILQEIVSKQTQREIIEVDNIYSSIEKSRALAAWSAAKHYSFNHRYHDNMEGMVFHTKEKGNYVVAIKDGGDESDTMDAVNQSHGRCATLGPYFTPFMVDENNSEYHATFDELQDSNPSHHTQSPCMDSNQFVSGFLMDIVYCQIDEFGEIQYLTTEKVNTEGRLLTLQAIEQPRAKHSPQVIIQWNQDLSADKWWYSIEMVLPNGDFAELGISSEPQFEISSPILDKVLKFRIRIIGALDDITSAVTVSVMPSPEPKTFILSDTVTLRAMEYFQQKYSKLEGVLGCGAFGSVSLIRDLQGNLYAAKIIKTRTQKKRDQALREFTIMQRLRHPRLVQLFDGFCSRDQFIMVMDYLWGGELFERIVEEDNFKEATAVTYVRQICEGLDYLHQQNIAHLDLKPENVVCLSPNSRDIKIVDFGLSRVLHGDVVRAIYGTRDYIAPEVLNFEPLTTYCDMWSLGVVTYVMLSGVIPFAGETWAVRSANITMARYSYEEPALLTVSSRAREFIDRLLVKSPAGRLSAEAALRHRWLVYGPPADLELGQVKRWRSNLRTYLATNKARWQRAGNVVIAANRLRARGLPAAQRPVT